MTNEEQVKEKLEKAGFEVVDEVEVGDLSDVKEERNLLPPVKGVKLRIRKATNQVNDAGTYRQLNVSLALEDGITVNNETKYKGMVVWARIPYFADASVYNGDYFKKQQHLVELKKLAIALGIDIKTIKVNDAFLEGLANQLLTADIWQKTSKYVLRNNKKVTINKKSPALEGEDVYDDVQNEVSNFKAVDTSSQV